MKRFIPFLFIICCSIMSNGQILGVNQPLFSDLPFFNTEFIKANSIKTISGTISSKKVKDIIRTKGLKSYYSFNENGMLKTQYSSILSNGKKDTSATFYDYNSEGQIKLKRKSDGDGFYSYSYQYDNKKNINTQTYYRDENKLKSKNKFELKKKYTIKTDSFSHETFGKEQTKKTFYNSYGIKFKIQTNTYDNLGYLTEEYSKFIIGNNKKKLSYEYDEYGRLFKKHIFTNISKEKKLTETYSYDEIGNVLEIQYSKNDVHTSTKQFLYSSKTMLLSAIIIQDITTSFLTIIKYDYTFFDGSTNYTNLNKLSISNTH